MRTKIVPNQFHDSNQVPSATSTFSSYPSTVRSNNTSKSPLNSKLGQTSQNVLINKGSVLKKKGSRPSSINGGPSYSPTFFSTGTQYSQSNPTYQYYYLKNQSAIPVAILLRNQYINMKSKRRQWQNHHVPLLKTTIEIFFEEEVNNSSALAMADPQLTRQASDVSALSSAESSAVAQQEDDIHDSHSIKSGPQLCTIFSKEHDASLHSCWNHLDDVLMSLNPDIHTDLGKQDWFHDRRYKSMKARVLVPEHELQRISNIDCEEEDSVESICFEVDVVNINGMSKNICNSLSHTQNNENSINKKFDDESTITIATIPLHPTFLRRLPPSQESQISNIGMSSSITPIPSSLPPNTLLVKYSDGSLRVLPPLYKLLLKNNIICEKSIDVDKLEADRINETKRTIRFSDHAFEALKDTENKNFNLDSITSSAKQKVKQNSDQIHDNDLYSLLGNASPGGTTNNEKGITKENIFDDVWKDLKSRDYGIDNHQIVTHELNIPTSIDDNAQDFESTIEDVSMLREEPDHLDFRNQELHSNISIVLSAQDTAHNFLGHGRLDVENHEIKELQQELESLEKIISEEEVAFEAESLLLETNVEDVKLLLKEIEAMEEESTLMRSKIKELTEEYHQSEFFMSIRQSKLIKELSQIYPIKRISNDRYTIRNLEIPTDLRNLFHSSEYDDPHISSALGYLSHAVSMCSKFISKPLRYKLICNASRSAVQGGQNGSLYPLFKDKVEKDQFDMGLTLLNRNIDCLLLTGKWKVDVDIGQGMNMLKKLHNIYTKLSLTDPVVECSEEVNIDVP